MTRYISEGTELYKNDSNKTWIASFQDPEDCKAVADSLNAKTTKPCENTYEESHEELSELEPALC
jgi:hypothetical protein